MIFDMRYIHDELNFKDRDVRDKSQEILPDYKPPDFVVNALQHTTVSFILSINSPCITLPTNSRCNTYTITNNYEPNE